MSSGRTCDGARPARDAGRRRSATWRRRRALRRACRTAARTGPPGRRCRGSSACRCRRGGTAEQTSTWIWPFVAVLRVVNVLPQEQVTVGLDVVGVDVGLHGGSSSCGRRVAVARWRGVEPEPRSRPVCQPAHGASTTAAGGRTDPGRRVAGSVAGPRRGLLDLHQELDVVPGLASACPAAAPAPAPARARRAPGAA